MASMFSLTIHSSTLSTRRPKLTDVATLAANLYMRVIRDAHAHLRFVKVPTAEHGAPNPPDP